MPGSTMIFFYYKASGAAPDASRAALPLGREPGETIVHANCAANDDFSMLLLYKISGLRPDFHRNFRPSAEWSS